MRKSLFNIGGVLNSDLSYLNTAVKESQTVEKIFDAACLTRLVP